MPIFTKIDVAYTSKHFVNSSLRCDTLTVYVQLNESQQRKNVTTNHDSTHTEAFNGTT